MDYKNGKIYSIRNTIDDDIYVGSTCQPLSKRMAEHRRHSKLYNGTGKVLHNKMKELGADIFYIELLLDYPCERREQLMAKEGEYIRNIGTLNKNINGRTKQQYKEDNLEFYKELYKQIRARNYDKNKAQDKARYERNKEQILEKQKQRRQKTIDLDRQKAREYRNAHIDEIRERQRAKMTCECGQIIAKKNLKRHQKAKNHLETMKNLNYSNNDAEQEENNTDEREGEIHTQTE